MTRGAPATDRDIGIQNMKASARNPDIETIHPKGVVGNVNKAARTEYHQAAAAAAVSAMPEGSEQEQLEQIEDVSVWSISLLH